MADPTEAAHDEGCPTLDPEPECPGCGGSFQCVGCGRPLDGIEPAPRTVTAEEVEAATAMLWPTYITVEDDVPRAAHRLGQALAALGVPVEVPRG